MSQENIKDKPGKPGAAKSALVEKANFLRSLTDVAYKDGAELKAAKAEFFANNKDWEVVECSHSLADSKSSQFKAIAIVNYKTGEVAIGHAGTKISLEDMKQSMQDAYADLQLAAGMAPDLKLAASKSFMKDVCGKLPNQGKDFTFTTTGHSLGGALSDFAAVELDSLGYNVTTSLTFDSAAAHDSIKYSLENELFTNNDKSISDLRGKINFEHFRAQEKNLVNDTEQMSTKEHIVVRNDNASNDQPLPVPVANPEEYGLISKITKVFAPLLTLKNLSTGCEYYKNYRDAEKIDEICKDLRKLEAGLIARAVKEVQPFQDVINDLQGIKANSGLMANSVSNLMEEESDGAGVIGMALGGFGLGCHMFNLVSHLSIALHKSIIVSNSIPNTLKGHSLKNFVNMTTDNVMPIQSKEGLDGSVLTVVSNHRVEDLKAMVALKKEQAIAKEEAIAKEKAVREQEAAKAEAIVKEKAVCEQEAAKAEAVESSSWSSWFYQKAASSVSTVKNAFVDYSARLSKVKVVLGNEIHEVDHDQLQKLTVKLSSSEAVDTADHISDILSSKDLETNDILQVTGEGYFDHPIAPAA